MKLENRIIGKMPFVVALSALFLYLVIDGFPASQAAAPWLLSAAVIALFVLAPMAIYLIVRNQKQNSRRRKAELERQISEASIASKEAPGFAPRR